VREQSTKNVNIIHSDIIQFHMFHINLNGSYYLKKKFLQQKLSTVKTLS
jgi:hypothetical protein